MRQFSTQKALKMVYKEIKFPHPSYAIMYWMRAQSAGSFFFHEMNNIWYRTQCFNPLFLNVCPLLVPLHVVHQLELPPGKNKKKLASRLGGQIASFIICYRLLLMLLPDWEARYNARNTD